MSRRYYNLPPFATLSTFEAAARHLSFKDAAEELGVTPGAVSHQIKALESELQTRLFHRRHRGVALSSEGEALYETLSITYLQISRQLTRLRRSAAANVVTVGCTTAVASLWLSPALIRFWRKHPNVQINQVAQDWPFRDVQDLDLFICYGKSPAANIAQVPIYRDELVPVASPAQAAVQGSALSDLAAQRLIHLDAENPSWTRWPEWFEYLDYSGPIAPGAKVTSYAVALQLACEGAGVALGWRRLIQPMLDSGQLAIVGDWSVPAPHQFYLAGHPDSDLSHEAQLLRDWLLAEASQSQLNSTKL